MKVVIDTCIIVDALQNREPFSQAAQKILMMSANYAIDAYTTAKAVTDVYYLCHKCTHSNDAARKIISDLLVIIGLADTAGADIREALTMGLSDFEDAVMVSTAVRIGAECIVTRNLKDFRNVEIPVYTPEQFLDMMDNMDEEIE